MKTILALLISFVSVGAQAEGFNCYDQEIHLKLSLSSSFIPRIDRGEVAAHISLSDPTVKTKKLRSIADIDERNAKVFNSRGLFYVAWLDSRFSGVSRGGEDIAGTKLSELQRITISIPNYRASKKHQNYKAIIHIFKEGEKTFSDGSKFQKTTAECTYRKN